MMTQHPMSLDELLRRRDAILAAARHHGASQVRVFGSVARGEASATSDIDLLVQMSAGRSLLDLCALGDELEDLLGRRVDVLTEAAISPHLRARVLAESVPL